jgi:hypothetical protein
MSWMRTQAAAAHLLCSRPRFRTSSICSRTSAAAVAAAEILHRGSRCVLRFI